METQLVDEMEDTDSSQRKWPRRLLAVVVAAGALAALWGGAHLLVDVQLPAPAAGDAVFTEPMDSDLPLRQAFEALPGQVTEHARFRVLDDNVDAWAERWRLLSDARDDLDISYYLLEGDVFGAAFLGHLIHKAGDGVRIRVLLDAIGTDMARDLEGHDYLDALVNTDMVKVRMYRPLRYRYRDTVLTLNPAAYAVSDHDKILVADGAVALTGGRNIAHEYFASPTDDASVYRDTDVLIVGEEVTSALRRAFAIHFESDETHVIEREIVNLKKSSEPLLLAYRAMDAWLKGEPVDESTAAALEEAGLTWLEDLEAMPGLRGALTRERPAEMTAPARIVDSSSRLLRSDDAITRSLVRLLRSAEDEVVIFTPYVVLLDGVVEILEETTTRGVRVTIVTNSPASSDHPFAGAILADQWPDLLARVPEIRLLAVNDGRNLHSKVAVLDRALVLIGTYNMDPLSMALNSEVVATLWSPQAAQQILRSIDGAAAGGSRVPVVEYRIAQFESGAIARDEDGDPVIAFGPANHLSDDQWSEARRYVPVVRALRSFRDRSVIF